MILNGFHRFGLLFCSPIFYNFFFNFNFDMVLYNLELEEWFWEKNLFNLINKLPGLRSETGVLWVENRRWLLSVMVEEIANPVVDILALLKLVTVLNWGCASDFDRNYLAGYIRVSLIYPLIHHWTITTDKRNCSSPLLIIELKENWIKKKDSYHFI